MKTKRSFVMAAILFAGLSVCLSAQAAPGHHKYSRYRLIDLGTFGGPQSYVSFPNFYAKVLNNRGMVAGYADTPDPDPFPDFCFDEDCFTAHAFLRGRGPKRDLGTLPGGASSAAFSIAENGLIAGISQNGETDPLAPGFPQFRGVLWRRGQITDLGTLDGGYETLASAVNSRGQLVGLATNTIPDPDSMFGLGFQTRAFLWHNGTMRDLGTLGTGTDAVALFVNERGQVGGDSYISSQPSQVCADAEVGTLATGAFLWDRGAMINLGSFGGTCTFVQDMNNRGQVVGGSRLAGDEQQHPYLWSNGTMRDLGTFGGNLGDATAVNDAGQAVGWATDPTDTAFAALWRQGTAKNLGTIRGDAFSFALDINEAGQVIGLSVPPDTDFFHARAFLWQKGGPMVDLKSLVSPPTNLLINAPETINDRGEIAGMALDADENLHAILLVPCGANEGCSDFDPGEEAAVEGELPARPALSNNDSSRLSALLKPRLAVLKHPFLEAARTNTTAGSDVCTRCCGPCYGVALTPRSLSFTAVVGTKSAPQKATLMNVGIYPVHVGAFRLPDPSYRTTIARAHCRGTHPVGFLSSSRLERKGQRAVG